MDENQEFPNFEVNYDPHDNKLTVGFIGEKAADGDVCLKQAATQLARLYNQMVKEGNGKVLKVYGRLSALIAAHIGTVFGNAFPAVAVFDTSANKFVIVSTRVSRHDIGDKLD